MSGEREREREICVVCVGDSTHHSISDQHLLCVLCDDDDYGCGQSQISFAPYKVRALLSTSVKLVRYDSPVCYILRRLNLLEGWLRALRVDFARAKLVGVGHATEVKDAMLCGGLRARGTMEERPRPGSDDWAEKIESAQRLSHKKTSKLGPRGIRYGCHGAAGIMGRTGRRGLFFLAGPRST